MEAETDLLKIQQTSSLLDNELKRKDLSWYDRKTIADIKSKLISAQAQAGIASASNLSAQASITNAKAAMINSQSNQSYKNLDIQWQHKHPFLNTFSRSGAGSLIKPR